MCFEIEECVEIESACIGSGSVCVYREGEYTERERERDGKCVQREGRSGF